MRHSVNFPSISQFITNALSIMPLHYIDLCDRLEAVRIVA